MKELLTIRNNKADGAALSACKLSPFLQLAHARGRRNIRIALPAAPGHLLCAIDRSLQKSIRSAELAFWEATGGDYLRSSAAIDLMPS